MARFSFQQEFQIMKDISLGAMSIFSSLLAIVATARLIPQDIEDRTVYTILAKPVPRFEYLLGKLFGVLLLLEISIALMSALFVVVLYVPERTVLHETLRQMSRAPGEQLEAAVNAIGAPGRNIEILHGPAVIYLNARLLVAFAMLLAYGVMKLPAQRALSLQHPSASGGQSDDIANLDLREKIGQLGFVAALSGFRAMLADFIFIQTHAAWERTEWGRVLS